MYVLSYMFNTMKWFAIWRPVEWQSNWKKNLYWLYTLTIVIGLSLGPISEIIYLAKFVTDIDEIASSSFLFLTEASLVYKASNILSRRQDIIKLTDTLTSDIGRPNGPEEMKIQRECDKKIKNDAMVYGGFVAACILSMWVTNYMNNVPQKSLSYNAWTPFDHSSGIGYWIAYLYQVIAQGINGTLTVAYDTLFCALMGQACAQMKILQYRLQTMPQTIVNGVKNDKDKNDDNNQENNDKLEIVEDDENKVLQRCIRHHHVIFDYTKLMNDVFGVAIFVQTSISTFVLCCSIYKLSQMKPLSQEFTAMASYMICMLIQIFLYCWWGNEVTLESTDVRNGVYAMEWTNLKIGTQKNLVILMARTSKPIEFASASVIVLSLETYKSLIKLSYSMYNLLQQTSES